MLQHKKFKYEVDRRGNVLKAVKIHPVLKKELDDTFRRFRDVFGRKPGKGDLVFFELFLDGEEDRWQAIRKIAKDTSIR
jgi:hypothetical protein